MVTSSDTQCVDVAGGAVEVTLTGSDDLSGVDATSCAVDGGEAKNYAGPFSFGTEGAHTIRFWSKDKAGNVETAGALLTLRSTRPSPPPR